MAKNSTEKNNTAPNLGFEAKPWQTLTALRDALLPQLFFGELCVKDTERIIGRYADVWHFK